MSHEISPEKSGLFLRLRFGRPPINTYQRALGGDVMHQCMVLKDGVVHCIETNGMACHNSCLNRVHCKLLILISYICIESIESIETVKKGNPPHCQPPIQLMVLRCKGIWCDIFHSILSQSDLNRHNRHILYINQQVILRQTLRQPSLNTPNSDLDRRTRSSCSKTMRHNDVVKEYEV